jgi:type IV pilus assembly protein PilN
MRIQVNLATRPFTDLGPFVRRLRVAIAVLAVLSLALGIGLHLIGEQADDARAKERVIDIKIAKIRAERQAAENMMHQPDNAQLLKQAEFLNQRFDEKGFSWTLAMEAMERVLPAGVQVTSIEPTRSKAGTISVHLRVIGPRDHVEELVRNLETSRRFVEPRIVGENAETGNGPSQRLEPVSASNRFDFDLLADYNPPTPEERAAETKQEKAAMPPAKPMVAPVVLNPPRQLPLLPQPQRAGAVPQPMVHMQNNRPPQMQPGQRPAEPSFPKLPPRTMPNQTPGGQQ